MINSNYKNSYYISQNAVSKPNFKGSSKDTPSNQAKNEGLSSGAKWGIGLGLVALASVGVYLATKKKPDSKQVSEAIKHFSPAKNIDEAKNYAKKELGVEYVDDNLANLDMMNTVNEWIHKEKIYRKNETPNAVFFSKEESIDSPLGLIDEIEFNGNKFNCLKINVNIVEKFDDFLNKAYEYRLKKFIKKNDKNKYELINPEHSNYNLDKLIEKMNAHNEKSSYKEKMEIFSGISEAITYFNKIGKGEKATMSSFSHEDAFIHEIGHLLHSKKYKHYNDSAERKAIFKEFKENKTHIAEKVSEYAKNSPLEFVAETYKKIRKGETLSDDVKKLYREYDGPGGFPDEIPNIINKENDESYLIGALLGSV